MIGVTVGDLCGIGPEIVVKALADPAIRQLGKFIIFGTDEQLRYAAGRAEIEPFWGKYSYEKLSTDFPQKVAVADYDKYFIDPRISGPSKISGQASLEFCKDAIEAIQNNITDAIVTAPISKVSWNMAGAKWPGHTEMLAELCKSPRKVMMFVAGKMRLALATIHERLFDVRHKFTIGCVFEPIDLLNIALQTYFDIEKPLIAVAALNPHAGENGQFGDEEQRIIAPAILMAQEQGINCFGPVAADSLFIKAAQGEYDGLVAMYHDQAMIPIKLIARDNAVNVTIGIPIIRTSPAHGTAFDIVGKNIANPDSMKAALKTAIEMVQIKKLNQHNLKVNHNAQ